MVTNKGITYLFINQLSLFGSFILERSREAEGMVWGIYSECSIEFGRHKRKWGIGEAAVALSFDYCCQIHRKENTRFREFIISYLPALSQWPEPMHRRMAHSLASTVRH